MLVIIKSQPTHIRQLVERALGSPINDREKRHLEDEGYIELIEGGEPGAINRAVTALRDGREIFGASMAPRRRGGRADVSNNPRRRPRPFDVHVDALSDLLAIHASQDPARIENPEARASVRSLGVVAFRREVLRGRLLTLERVGSWIRDQATRQRPAKRPALLAYGLPSNPHRFHEVVSPGGPLDRLRKVSEGLSKFYGWQDAQATVFVLTGDTPRLDAIMDTVRFREPLSARSRIVLTVDPKVTPAELARYYQTVRREEFGGRMRRLSEKHARLAVFTAQQQDDDSPDEERKRWNEQCRVWKRPKWRYKKTSQFKRDRQKAVERLAEL